MRWASWPNSRRSVARPNDQCPGRAWRRLAGDKFVMKSRILLIPKGVPPMRRFIVGLFAVIGALVVLLIIAGGAAWHYLKPHTPVIAASTILDLDLTRSLGKGPAGDPFGHLLFENRLTLRDVLDALQRAGDDPRVKGVVARIGSDESGTATAQELR